MPVSRNGRAYYTQEQYESARSASALEYALRRGYDLVPQGHRFYLREHDSMVFLPNGLWHWNSRGLHGRALEFARHYEKKPLPEAVLAVIEAGAPSGQREEATQGERVSAPLFRLPEPEAENSQLFEYLTQTRRLDREIVEELVRCGSVYMTVRQCGTIIYRNAVFVGVDSAGVPRSATLRGLAYGSTFKGEVAGSDKRALFALPCAEGADTLAVFEGAIDAISHATLDKRARTDWRRIGRVSQGGDAAPGAVAAYLEQHPRFRRVLACYDNDAAGRALEERLRAELQGREVASATPPSGKDWNEYLIQRIALGA